jgi:hypothetical protein
MESAIARVRIIEASLTKPNLKCPTPAMSDNRYYVKLLEMACRGVKIPGPVTMQSFALYVCS